MAALIEQEQPYHAGNRADNHALSVLQWLNNTDKHRALVLHVVAVHPDVRLTMTENTNAAWRVDTIVDAPDLDDRTRAVLQASYEVVNVQRRLGAIVAFAQFGNARLRRPLAADQGLRFLRRAVGQIIDQFRSEVR